MKSISIFLFLLITLASNAQDNKTSGLNARQFHKYWKVESESPDYKVTFRGDTAEILSSKGLTLWRKEKMSGKVTIEYDACVVVEAEGDRLSDLNCFWMASDPQYPDNIWKREKWRNGIFLNCYSLQLYYMGYGGNHNSTTRFRRYDGNEAARVDTKARPAILKEYTDADHLLEANKWYHIKITNENNRVSYYINGVRLVDFRDAEPLTEGWFGFRTTLSRTRIANFHYECSSQETSEIPLHWIGNTPQQNKAVSLGVPFNEGELYPEHTLQLMTDKGEMLPTDTWGNIFKYPELSDSERASELISAFEEKQEFKDLFTVDKENGNPGTGIQVYIGNESPMQGMKDCSVVTATYDLGKGIRGTVGIVGPKRMDYEKVVDNLRTLKVQLDDIFKKTDE